MAVQIKVRRGTFSQLGTTTLAENEIGFTTDTKQLWVGGGSGPLLSGQVEEGTSLPTYTDRAEGSWFYRSDEGKLYLRRATAWEQVGAGSLSDLSGDLDDIADGTNYQRVASSEVDSNGYVTQINDDTNVVTAAQARTHIDSTTNPHTVTLTQAATAGGDLDNIDDGTNYGKVLNTELASGQVTQVRAVVGTADVTGDQIKNHIDSTANPHTVTLTQAATAGGDLDDINDGTNYQRVASSEVDASGYVTQINDGTDVVTASQARTHIDTVSGNPHQVAVAELSSGTLSDLNGVLSDATAVGLAYVDDTTTTSAVVWSATKVQNVVDNAISGLTWRDPVDEQATAPTGNESGNDGWRVLINGTGTGDFSGQDNAIATWDDTGSSWSFQAPSENWALLDKATDAAYTYDADTTAWVQFSGAGQIDAGTGLSKSGNVIYANLGAGIKELPTDEIGLDLASNSGLTVGAGGSGAQLAIDPNVTDTTTVVPINLSSNGAGVVVDNSTVENNAGTLQVKAAGITATELAGTSVTAAKLGNDVAGDGLVGGNGAAIDVNAGNGIALSGDAVTVDPYSGADGSVAPVYVDADGLGVDTDDSTIGVSGSALYVKNSGVTETQLAASVAGDGLVGGAGTALSVNVDGSTIAIDTDVVGIPAGGVTATEINSAVAGDGLAGGGGSALSVNVDDATIEIATDTLQVKADGIGATELDETDTYDFTSGSVSVATQTQGNNSNLAANTAYVDAAVSGAGLTGGNGIDITTQIVSVDVAAAGALSNTGGTGDELAVLVDGSTIGIDGSNQVYIPNTGVTEAQLNTSVAGNGLSGGGGTALTVSADGTTGATVAPLSVTSNGAGLTVDNDTIKHTSGEIYVDAIDGGTFA